MVERSPRRRATRAPRLVVAAVVGAVFALVALRAVPGFTHDLGPAEVSVSASTGSGDTRFAIPPLGTVSASTHAGPLSYEVTLDQIDFAAFGRSFARFDTRAQLMDEMESSLRGIALSVAVRLALAAALLGAVACALLPRRDRTSVVVGAVAGFAVVASSVALSAATFNVEAFREPRYTGALERAPQVLESLDRHTSGLTDLRSRFAEGADRLTHLLAIVGEPIADPHVGTTAILHISDIHSNPVGLEIARGLAERFAVDAVLDTGDLTSFGEDIEARLGRLIAGFDVPYLFVPGNHDSIYNRRQLGRVANVRLVHREVVEVGGVSILGWADPTFTASGEVTTEEGNLAREMAAERVAESVRALAPDVLAVHDARLAGDSVGHVPLIVAGHTHRRAMEERDGTVILWVGSTGATGLGSLVQEIDLDYEAQILYFREGRAVGFDYVRFTGFGGDFRVERRTLDPDTTEATRMRMPDEPRPADAGVTP